MFVRIAGSMITSTLVLECMVLASQTVFDTYRRPIIPSWNEFVLEAHNEAREAFPEWWLGGGPHWRQLAERMRSTRTRYKLWLSWCKSHEQQLRAQSLAAKLASGFLRFLVCSAHHEPVCTYSSPTCGSDGVGSWLCHYVRDHYRDSQSCERSCELECFSWWNE